MSIAYCLSFDAAGLRNRFNNTITPRRTASTRKIIAMPRATIIKASIKAVSPMGDYYTKLFPSGARNQRNLSP
jgi:hypothetical protein